MTVFMRKLFTALTRQLFSQKKFKNCQIINKVLNTPPKKETNYACLIDLFQSQNFFSFFV